MPQMDCPPPEVATCNPPPPEVVVCPADLSLLARDAYQPPPAPRQIGRREDGVCWEEFDANCPPYEEGTTCNPPEPQEVACPMDSAELRYDHFKPVPLVEIAPPRNPPFPQEVAIPVPPPAKPPALVRRDAKGTCWTEAIDTCTEADGLCNPPPPLPTECPTDLSKLASDDYKPLPLPLGRVYQRPNGECFEDVAPNCPPPVEGIHVSCNPPPPRRVQCPPELAKPAK